MGCYLIELYLSRSAWLAGPAIRAGTRRTRDVPQHQRLDGHTLGPMVADLEKLTGIKAQRIHVEKGYRGPNVVPPCPYGAR